MSIFSAHIVFSPFPCLQSGTTAQAGHDAILTRDVFFRLGVDKTRRAFDSRGEDFGRILGLGPPKRTLGKCGTSGIMVDEFLLPSAQKE